MQIPPISSLRLSPPSSRSRRRGGRAAIAPNSQLCFTANTRVWAGGAGAERPAEGRGQKAVEQRGPDCGVQVRRHLSCSKRQRPMEACVASRASSGLRCTKDQYILALSTQRAFSPFSARGRTSLLFVPTTIPSRHRDANRAWHRSFRRCTVACAKQPPLTLCFVLLYSFWQPPDTAQGARRVASSTRTTHDPVVVSCHVAREGGSLCDPPQDSPEYARTAPTMWARRGEVGRRTHSCARHCHGPTA